MSKIYRPTQISSLKVLSSCISLKLWFRYCVADSENGIKIWSSVGQVGESVNIMEIEIAVLECTKW